MKKLKILIASLLAFIATAAYADPVQTQWMINGMFITTSGGAKVSLPERRTFANIAASQTDSSVIAAVTGKVIRVLAIANVAGATATNITFNSKGSGAGVAISPLFANGINGGEVLPFNPMGWMETVSGEALTATTGAGATTGIIVTYITY